MRSSSKKSLKTFVELQNDWEKMKPIILKHLEDGWSKCVSFKKAGLMEHTDLYFLCYSNDHEFKTLISKYNQRKDSGFYKNLISDKSAI